MPDVPEPPAHSRRCPPPVADPQPVTIELPAHATDSHCHVFGPHGRFPYAPERTFTPVDVPYETLRARHDLLGFERALVVQSACHGSDHHALLDALARSGGRYRGVGLVTPQTTPATIAEWDAAGICGARLNFLPHLGGAPTADTIARVVDLIGPYGWHLSIHVAGDGVSDYAGTIAAIEVPVVLDHIARVGPPVDLGGRRVADLEALLDTGDVWVKLSGTDRLSGGPTPDQAALRLAARLAARAPDRVVWGTDFPHPNLEGAAPDDGVLVNALATIAPTMVERQRLLVDNPAALFGW